MVNVSRKMKKQNNSKKKLIIFSILLLVLLVVGAYFAYQWYDNKQDAQQPVRTTNSINYDPPTEEEQKSGDEQKETITQQESQKPPETASVAISNTSQSGNVVRVRAFVANAAEDNGTCTTTLTKGASVVSKTTQAFADASTTQCGAIDFTRSQFASAGTWQVKVTYTSQNLEGSATTTIDIE